MIVLRESQIVLFKRPAYAPPDKVGERSYVQINAGAVQRASSNSAVLGSWNITAIRRNLSRAVSNPGLN